MNEAPCKATFSLPIWMAHEVSLFGVWVPFSQSLSIKKHSGGGISSSGLVGLLTLLSSEPREKLAATITPELWRGAVWNPQAALLRIWLALLLP